MNWKDVPGYEGLYQISDCGQVKSCERFVRHPKGDLKKIKEKIMTPRKHTGGYQKISLYKENKEKSFFIHRLVMYAFSHVDETMTVNHIDENKNNNHISNLEYMTQVDNAKLWCNNNKEININRLKKATNLISVKIYDTQTCKIFPSIMSVSRYMYEEEGAKGLWVWYNKIKTNKQDRFQILNSSNI